MLSLPHLATLALTASPVLRPSATAGRWDSSNVANPVVLPPRKGVANDPWRMFYYGSDGTWADKSVQPFLPTGQCGLATSTDGLTWTRATEECTFSPGPAGAWDSLHVGVGGVGLLQSVPAVGRVYFLEMISKACTLIKSRKHT